MPVRRVYTHGNVQADRGRVALMRGPIVYCLEATDHTFDVLNAVLPKDAKLTPEHRDDLLGGVTVLRGRGLADGEKAADLTAVPYYVWQNRGIGEMAVWLIEDASLCRRPPKPDPGNRATIATPSASCEQVGANSLAALNDGILPKHSGDTSLVRMAWWPRKGSTEWVQYDFRTPETIDRIAVYWFQDHPRGGCKLPASWRLLYHAGGKWLPVPNAGEYVTARDRLVELKFDPLKTTALRIEVRLQTGFSGGICEWRIEPCLNIDG